MHALDLIDSALKSTRFQLSNAPKIKSKSHLVDDISPIENGTILGFSSFLLVFFTFLFQIITRTPALIKRYCLRLNKINWHFFRAPLFFSGHLISFFKKVSEFGHQCVRKKTCDSTLKHLTSERFWAAIDRACQSLYDTATKRSINANP